LGENYSELGRVLLDNMTKRGRTREGLQKEKKKGACRVGKGIVSLGEDGEIGKRPPVVKKKTDFQKEERIAGPSGQHYGWRGFRTEKKRQHHGHWEKNEGSCLGGKKGGDMAGGWKGCSTAYRRVGGDLGGGFPLFIGGKKPKGGGKFM